MPQSTYVTLGYPREDGDFDVLATFNFDNCRTPREAAALEALVHELALRFECEIHERQDAPDVINLESYASV